MDCVLLLNADHTPIKTLAWQRAVSLLVQDKVVLVLGDESAPIRSQHLQVPRPSVVALSRYVTVRVVPAPTRRNVHARDGWACAYCGTSPGRSELTLDHVVPRSRAAHGFVRASDDRHVPVNGWENLVTSCAPCNHAKGARTPDEAGLTLARAPWKPQTRELLLPGLGGAVPTTWAPWLNPRVA